MNRGPSPPDRKAVRSTTPSRHEIVLSRIIDASQAAVFGAWTEPAHLAAWWGPRGFTNPLCKVDLRPGGAYRIVMRSPEGVEYPLKGIYHEIVPPSRLVMTIDVREHPNEWHELLNTYRRDEEGQRVPELLCTVTFEAIDGSDSTRITLHNRFQSPADRDAMLSMGMIEGWSQSLERLEEHLTSRKNFRPLGEHGKKQP